MAKQWYVLPRELVEFSSLKHSKQCWAIVFSNLLWWPPLSVGCWTRSSPEVPSGLSCSVTLYLDVSEQRTNTPCNIRQVGFFLYYFCCPKLLHLLYLSLGMNVHVYRSVYTYLFVVNVPGGQDKQETIRGGKGGGEYFYIFLKYPAVVSFCQHWFSVLCCDCRVKNAR